MKKIITLAVVVLVSACNFISVKGVSAMNSSASVEVIAPSHNIVTKDIPVAEFTSLKVNLPCEIKYSTGAPSCQIVAPDNVIEHIMAYVEDRQLVLELDKVRLRNYSELEISISSWALCGLYINGAADFETNGKICAEDFECVVNGACDIEIDGIIAENINVTINGAGDIDVAGIDSKTVTAQINGAGDCELSGKTDTATLTIAGAGNIDIEHLNAGNVISSVKGIGSISRR